MKKTVSFCIGFFLLLGLLAPAAAQEEKTETEVISISNPKKPTAPKGAAIRLTLKEDYAVGDSEKEEEMIAQLTFFAVDDADNLYALDIKGHCVKVFDPSGTYIRTIGSQGQGPGELNMPAGIQITPDNELMIEDVMNRRLSYFTLSGEFIKTVSVADKTSLINLFLDKEGSAVGRELVLDEGKMFWEIRKYDQDLEPLFTIDKVEFQNPLQGKKLDPFSFIVVVQYDAAGSIYFGKADDYIIQVYNPDGTLTKRIQKKYDKVKITQEDKDKMLEEIPDMGVGINIKEMFEFPDAYPPYESFTLTEQGWIVVKTYGKGPGEGEFFLDIFDQDGKYIASFPSPANPRLWKKDKLYSIEDTDEGFKVIKRYTVSWEK